MARAVPPQEQQAQGPLQVAGGARHANGKSHEKRVASQKLALAENLRLPLLESVHWRACKSLTRTHALRCQVALKTQTALSRERAVELRAKELRRFGRVGFFAVERHIEAALFGFFRCAHAAHHFDDRKQNERNRERISRDDGRANQLRDRRARAARNDERVDARERARSENARQNRAREAADAVNRESVERIVHAIFRANSRHRVTHSRGDDAHQNRADGRNKAARGRNSNQARDGARSGAKRGHFFAGEQINQHPRQHRRRRAKGCVHKSQHAQSARAARRTRVKSIPAEPQNADTQQTQRQGMRKHRALVVAAPRAHNECARQSREARVDVNDGAAPRNPSRLW